MKEQYSHTTKQVCVGRMHINLYVSKILIEKTMIS